MRYLKMVVLTVAMTVLMAFVASSASATALYNGGTKLGVGATLDFSLAGLTRAILVDTGGEPLDECSTSTIKASISNAGGASATVSGSISELTWGSCTWTTKTVTLGGLQIHQIGTGTNGTVTTNAEIGVTIDIPFFGSCVYGDENGVDLGTLTTVSSGVAQFHANAVVERLSPSSIVCPETAKWTGTYYNTEPSNLRVESS